jgi:Ala-tRNA(Pro) deacylase
MPPFGNVYGLQVYVSGTMADVERIAFPAGTHTELLRMSYADFEQLVEPKVARFTFLQQSEMEAEG